jgi:hypothetical protein
MKPERIVSARRLCRLKKNLDFLPPELRKRFIDENSLVVLQDGYLIDKEDYLNPPAF